MLETRAHKICFRLAYVKQAIGLLLHIQILRYDSTRLSHFGALFSITGTVFSTRFMYIQMGVLFALMHIVGVTVWGLYAVLTSHADLKTPLDPYQADTLVGYVPYIIESTC